MTASDNYPPIEPSNAAIFRRIVCGVDGSPEGLEAVRQASRLATTQSELVVVSVNESHLAVHAGVHATYWAEQLKREAQSALDQAEQFASGAETHLLHGRAAETLLRAATEARATVIAVGSHEHSRGAGMILGSVATTVVHEASCSVLIVRAPADPERFPGSIVAGVDGSPASFAAAALAEELGERLGAPVEFVVARGGRATDIGVDELARSAFELTYSDAKPVPALLEASRDADLLVVGSRGLRGLRALGSVSERVAHHARCSLLVLRP